MSVKCQIDAGPFIAAPLKWRSTGAGKEVCNNKTVSAKFSPTRFEEFPTFQKASGGERGELPL